MTKVKHPNSVYFPETDESYRLVPIKGEDGIVRETLVTQEEFESLWLQARLKGYYA